MVLGEGATKSLVDQLAHELGCQYLSDLGFLQGSQLAYLADIIKGIPADAVSLFEWNDALAYLVEAPPAQDSATARSQLLHALTTPS